MSAISSDEARKNPINRALTEAHASVSSRDMSIEIALDESLQPHAHHSARDWGELPECPMAGLPSDAANGITSVQVASDILAGALNGRTNLDADLYDFRYGTK